MLLTSEEWNGAGFSKAMWKPGIRDWVVFLIEKTPELRI